MLKHATRLNTCTELAITKLDVLSPFKELKVCVAYDVDGDRHHGCCECGDHQQLLGRRQVTRQPCSVGGNGCDRVEEQGPTHRVQLHDVDEAEHSGRDPHAQRREGNHAGRRAHILAALARMLSSDAR